MEKFCFGNDSLQWCFSTLGCPDADVPKALAIADDYGIPFIEIRVISGGMDIPGELAKLESSNPAFFNQLAESRRVRVIGTSFHVAARNEDNERELLAIAQWADRLHVPFLRVFGGFDYAPELGEDRLQASVATLKWWQGIKAQKGIKCDIALETHDGYSSIAHCRKLMDAAQMKLSLVWDAPNAWCASGEGMDVADDLIKDGTIVHLHVKDEQHDDTPRGFHSVLPGTGDVPVRELLDRVRDLNYTGTVSLEWEKKWQPEIPELEPALDSVAQYWL